MKTETHDLHSGADGVPSHIPTRLKTGLLFTRHSAAGGNDDALVHGQRRATELGFEIVGARTLTSVGDRADWASLLILPDGMTVADALLVEDLTRLGRNWPSVQRAIAATAALGMDIVLYGEPIQSTAAEWVAFLTQSEGTSA